MPTPQVEKLVCYNLNNLESSRNSNGLAENVFTNSHRFLHVAVFLYCVYIDLTQFF